MAHDDSATEPLPAPQPTVAIDLIGRVLGKFTIVERLGKGGSGEVFRAEQAQLGRSVVIKVLRREAAASPNRIERFLREAKLASRLDHPYAAHVYAFGAEPDGVLWIAMEHVKGMTLDELVGRRGAMPAHVFAALFTRLCEVVHSAHDLGIVHRDIKGGNVMVIERAGQLLPKLLDFGIAKSGDGLTSPGVDAGGVANDHLTGHGTTLGSPHYMSPEQWERPSEVDARADIYALGVLAYRCISGSLPFETLERAKLGDAHLRRTPPPLPDVVPAPLATAVMRALAKQPDERWPTAIAFAEAVQRAAGLVAAPEQVPIFDAATRDTWLRAGPQPIADAIAHLTSATTTVEVDAALREVVAIACRWLAVLALSTVEVVEPKVREHARGVIGRDDGAPWLRLARAAAGPRALPGLVAALAGADALGALAEQLDDRDRSRTAAALATDVVAVAEALHPLEALLEYELVVGRGDGSADSWQGTRRRDRERRIVWGEQLGVGEVGLLDAERQVVARLSPLAQVVAPLPSAEPELFLLWRGGRGPARLVAAPWGFERDDDAAGHRLAALSTEDSDTSADPASDRSPYPGLAAYGVEDAEHFVGREREIEALANRLVRAPMIAVLGPSGVGKSSFMHAGVIPRLAEHYRVLTMRPGRRPLHALAALPAVSGDIDDASALVARVRELGESAARGVVIVIDQLEELVTLGSSADDRRRFAEILAAAADGPGAPVRVVATLRDDFATVIEAEPAFRGRFEVFVLATPPPEALRRIVVEPARRMAVTVDADVVDDMVAEVAGRPASLPLLSFTGSLLWAARDRTARKITHDAYAGLGGVAGALAAYADQVYASLARRDQDTVRDLFSRLVAADGTRIPAPRAELEQVSGAKAVVAHLIDARLLSVRDEDGSDVVEIIHECLAERWPRLARWRSEDAADRALLGDVRVAARRWIEAKRVDLLWRGQALAELRRLAARSTALTDTERAFADESDRAQRRARRLRRGFVAAAMIVLAGVAAVMAYLGIAANESRGEAERSAASATASAKLAEDRLTTSLIAQGRRELNDGRALPALAYFGEAMRRGADTIGLREMISIASRAWPHQRLVIRPATFSALATMPGAIIAGDQQGTLHFWAPDAKPIGELQTDIGDVMSFKQHGDRLVASGQRAVIVVDPAARKVLHRIAPKSPAFISDLGPGADEITCVEHDAINVYGFDGKVRRTTPLTGSEEGWSPVFADNHVLVAIGQKLGIIDRTTMQRHDIDEGGTAFPVSSDDGAVIAFVDKKHQVRIIDGTGATLRTIETHHEPVGVVLSATGDRIAAFAMRQVVIYDAQGKALHSFPIEGEQQVFEVRGDDLWMGTNDGVVRHYHDGALVASLPIHAGQIEELAVEGDTLAAIAGDSSLVLVDAATAQLVVEPPPCKQFEPVSGGIGMSLICDDGDEFVYIGRRRITAAKGVGLGYLAVDPVSERVAMSGSKVIAVYDRDGKQLVHSKDNDPGGALAFIDADHLLVGEPLDGKGVNLWQLSTNHFEHVVDDTNTSAIIVTKGGWLVGHVDGHVTLIRDRKEVHRVELGNRVDFFTTSPDGAWVAAQLGNGVCVILDGATGDPVRSLATADAVGTASVLDPTGELVIRPSRSTLTLWERATGDELVWSFDLLKPAISARMRADGRIDVGGFSIGTIDIPRDNRPPAQVIHDIECRVPFRVVGGRLEPAPATQSCR